MLDGQKWLRIFDLRRETLSAGRIMGDDLLHTARHINLRYAHLYNGVPETETNAHTEWEKLDAFTRYSNISSADYHEIRLQMLAAMGAKPDGTGLTDAQREALEKERVRLESCLAATANHIKQVHRRRNIDNSLIRNNKRIADICTRIIDIIDKAVNIRPGKIRIHERIYALQNLFVIVFRKRLAQEFDKIAHFALHRI